MSKQLILKNECKKGTEVYLVKPDPLYTLDKTNPVKGGEFECIGVIIETNQGVSRVEWKNGITNYYKDGELAPVKIEYHSIWPKGNDYG